MRRRVGVVRSIPFYTKIVAASRALGAKHIYVPLVDYYSPPLGSVVVIFGMAIFFIGETPRTLVLPVPLNPASLDVRPASVHLP